MSLFELLFSFSGRIGRRSWWIGFAIGCAAGLVGTLALDPGLLFADRPRAPHANLALWNLAWVIPMTAITVKRFNDRDRPQWIGYAVGAVGIALIVAEQMGFMVDPDRATRGERALFWVTAAAMLAALIDNALLKGTPGPNRYGRDPIAAPEVELPSPG